MPRLLATVGGTLGSYLGWALGAPVGQMTAFLCSVVAGALGVYCGRRVARHMVG